MEKHKRPRITAALTIVVVAFLLAAEARSGTATEDLRLIIAPRATNPTAEGDVVLDAYLYNESDQKHTVPAPDAISNVYWTLRDTVGNRPERHGSGGIIGTDAAEQCIVNPGAAIHFVLATHFDCEPGDLLEFYVSVDTKVNKVKTDLKPGESLKSNSVILFRPKEGETAH